MDHITVGKLLVIGSIAVVCCLMSCTAVTKFFDSDLSSAEPAGEARSDKRIPLPPTVNDFEPKN
ncbi:MAG: hypothetical protein WCJ75_10840 [Desulfomonile sp.]|jgi:hypothetical protein